MYEKGAEIIAGVGAGAELDGPSFLRRARNYAAAMFRFWRGGKRYTDEATFYLRVEACAPCEWRGGRLCQHEECGCEILVKAKWATESCPIGRWPGQAIASRPGGG